MTEDEYDSKKSQFDRLTNEYLEHTKDYKKDKKQSRISKIKPLLNYRPVGNYGYIQNYQTVCSYFDRSIDHLYMFLNSYLGCKIELTQSFMRTLGVVKSTHFKIVEKKFYNNEIMCPSCKSPQTKRYNEEEISCSQCGLKTPRVLKR